MQISKFGDVTSSALDVMLKPTAQKDLYHNFAIHAGEIVAIYTSDDPENQLGDDQGQYTLYDVRITRPDGTTEVMRRCRALQPVFGGGLNNYLESVPTDPSAEADDFDKVRGDRRGHHCVVASIGGYKGAGIILGGLPHSGDAASMNRPSISEGVVTRGEIQGLTFEVNNDGELTITFNGPKDDTGTVIDASSGPTEIKIDKTGAFTIKTSNEDQTITVDPVASMVEIVNKDTKITMDGEGDQITLVASVVQTGESSTQPHLVGDDWKTLMEDLIDEISQIIVPTGVGPSGPPQNAPKFSAIKAKLKNALSTKHVVEK